MARPRKNPADKKTKSVTRVKKLKDLLSGQTTPQEAENRRMQLKALIIMGKERGYLTHSEINDHLPDEVSESEQVEGIIGIINSPRNGNISSSFPVFDGDEILISTNKGRVIRVAVKEIRTAGRNTQGVRIIKLSGEEKVVSADKIDDNLV